MKIIENEKNKVKDMIEKKEILKLELRFMKIQKILKDITR